MDRRLFFLNNEGWFEEELTGRLLHASQEELVLWAYAMIDRHGYRNYWITENPERGVTGKKRLPSYFLKEVAFQRTKCS